MSKPQQPEAARSGRGATDPAAIKSELSVPAMRRATVEDAGPVPEANLPGHHPDEEQDKPAGEAFLQKMHSHATEVDAARQEAATPQPTVAGDVARAAAGVVRRVREAFPGD